MSVKSVQPLTARSIATRARKRLESVAVVIASRASLSLRRIKQPKAAGFKDEASVNLAAKKPAGLYHLQSGVPLRGNPPPPIGDTFQCPVCARMFTVEKLLVNLDHDSETGEIRGYICNDCNTGMGKMRDDISTFARAILWLKQAGKISSG